MKIQEKMSKDIVTCCPTDNVKEVAQTMRSLDIGCLPVVENEKVVGMITDRDIVTRGVAKKRAATVSEVMSKKVISTHPNDTVENAASLMAENRIRRLPIIENNALVGFISLSDIAVSGTTKNLAGQALHEISEPRH